MTSVCHRNSRGGDSLLLTHSVLTGGSGFTSTYNRSPEVAGLQQAPALYTHCPSANVHRGRRALNASYMRTAGIVNRRCCPQHLGMFNPCSLPVDLVPASSPFHRKQGERWAAPLFQGLLVRGREDLSGGPVKTLRPSQPSTHVPSPYKLFAGQSKAIGFP